jgi:hypothetical protein
MKLSYIKDGKIFTELKDSVSFEIETDIAVIGLGASGCYAAIAAAREGARVLGIERDEGIGGMPVNGGVTFFYYGERGGTYETVNERANDLDKATFFVRGKQIESRRAVLHEMLAENGVDHVTGVTVTGLYMEDNRVTGVRVYGKGRTYSVKSTLLIDATSDGHIVRMCPYVKTYLGRSIDGKTVPFTNRSSAITPNGNLAHYNGDDGYCNQYEPYGFSERVLASHASKLAMVDDPTNRMIGVATTPGVREGLRYEGEEHLSYRDIISAKEPERILFFARSDLDKHGSDHAMDDEEYRNWWVISNLATVTARIPVPLGAVVPKGVLGMVSAGRCLSVDSYASSAVRMNTDMFRLGECVGIASALSVKGDCSFMDIDYEKYVCICRKYKCRDGVYKDRFAYDHPSQKSPYEPVDFNMSKEQIYDGLATEAPGVAIWGAHITKEDIDSDLERFLTSENRYLKFNSAVALGIRGSDKGLPVLRCEVENRNFEQYVGCRRSNQYKSAVAICLIGMLGDMEDMERLYPIITSEELRKPLYSEMGADSDDGARTRAADYQIFTHTVVAMRSIAKRYGEEASLTERLRETLDHDFAKKIINAVTFGKPASSLGVEIQDFIDHSRR